jgi:hypothetical protein
LKGNSSSQGFAVVKGIKGCNHAERVFCMYNPGVAIIRGKSVVDEVSLNALKRER